MSAYTPGPWIATPDPYSMRDGDYMIGREGHKPDEVAVCSKRDASLIAAAPELLSALNAAHMALIGYLPAHSNSVTDAAIESARAAIAKATGETP